MSDAPRSQDAVEDAGVNGEKNDGAGLSPKSSPTVRTQTRARMNMLYEKPKQVSFMPNRLTDNAGEQSIGHPNRNLVTKSSADDLSPTARRKHRLLQQ